MRKLLGAVLIGWPLALPLAAYAYRFGVIEALAIVAGVGLMLGSVMAGITLAATDTTERRFRGE